MKVCINSHGHMTKMTTMALNNKLLKNLLLQTQEAYDFETWHEVSRNGGLQNLYKSLPWDDLGLCYGNVNFGRQCI